MTPHEETLVLKALRHLVAAADSPGAGDIITELDAALADREKPPAEVNIQRVE